jgi:hypothetical protein
MRRSAEGLGDRSVAKIKHIGKRATVQATKHVGSIEWDVRCLPPELARVRIK